jgi:hypothetical protein
MSDVGSVVHDVTTQVTGGSEHRARKSVIDYARELVIQRHIKKFRSGALFTKPNWIAVQWAQRSASRLLEGRAKKIGDYIKSLPKHWPEEWKNECARAFFYGDPVTTPELRVAIRGQIESQLPAHAT